MGYVARANKSAETAKAAGYQKPERVTVARVRRTRRTEARDHVASIVAMQAIVAMMTRQGAAVDAELAGRLGAVQRRSRGGLTIIRHTDNDDRENVSGGNALQREAVTADLNAIAQEGAAPLTETTTTEPTL